MELVKSHVDAWQLDITNIRVFSKIDFYENWDGGVRLKLQIMPFLDETISQWTKKNEYVIEQVEAILSDGKSLEKKKQLNSLLIKIG